MSPQVLARADGRPVEALLHFTILDFSAYLPTGRLVVRNGRADGSGRSTSAVVNLNGEQVLGPSDFKDDGPSEITKPVTLTQTGTIAVTLRSAPGSEITVSVEATFKPGTARVGPGGGSLYSESGNFALDFPANAVTGSHVISIVEQESPGVPNEAALDFLGPLVRLRPEGITFDVPVSLRFNSAAAGQDPAAVVMGHVTDASAAEITLHHTESAYGWSVAMIDHFSDWTPAIAARVPPNQRDVTYGVTEYGGLNESAVDREVELAVRQWAHHLVPAGFTFQPATANPDIEIQIHDLPGLAAGEAYIICAWSRPECSGSADRPRRGIRVNPEISDKFTADYFARGPNTGPATINETVTHELGHVLSLIHHAPPASFFCLLGPSPQQRPECYTFESGDVMARVGGTLAGGPMTLSCHDLAMLSRKYPGVIEDGCAATVERASRQTVTAWPGLPLPMDDLPAVRVMSADGRPVPGVTVGFVSPDDNGRTVLAIEMTNSEGIARMPALEAPGGAALEIEAIVMGPGPLSDSRWIVHRFTISGETPVPSWCGASLDFDEGNLPANWTIDIVRNGPGLQNDQLQGHPTDSGARVGLTGNSMPGTTAISIEYDVQNAAAGSGMDHGVSLQTESGTYWFYAQNTSLSAISIFSRPALGLWPSPGNLPAAGMTIFVHPFGNHHYQLVLRDGSVEWTVDGAASPIAIHSVPGLVLSEITKLYWYVYTTTTNPIRGDNLSVACSSS